MRLLQVTAPRKEAQLNYHEKCVTAKLLFSSNYLLHQCAQYSSIFSQVCAFLHDICKLYVSFNDTINKIQSGDVSVIDPERPSLKDTLPREWKEVFAGECGHKFLAMWSDIVGELCCCQMSVDKTVCTHIAVLTWSALKYFLKQLCFSNRKYPAIRRVTSSCSFTPSTWPGPENLWNRVSSIIF